MIVKPVKSTTGTVPRIHPMAMTIERLRAAMDSKGKPNQGTVNVIDLLTGKGKGNG